MIKSRTEERKEIPLSGYDNKEGREKNHKQSNSVTRLLRIEHTHVSSKSLKRKHYLYSGHLISNPRSLQQFY